MVLHGTISSSTPNCTTDTPLDGQLSLENGWPELRKLPARKRKCSFQGQGSPASFSSSSSYSYSSAFILILNLESRPDSICPATTPPPRAPPRKALTWPLLDLCGPCVAALAQSLWTLMLCPSYLCFVVVCLPLHVPLFAFCSCITSLVETRCSFLLLFRKLQFVHSIVLKCRWWVDRRCRAENLIKSNCF